MSEHKRLTPSAARRLKASEHLSAERPIDSERCRHFSLQLKQTTSSPSGQHTWSYIVCTLQAKTSRCYQSSFVASLGEYYGQIKEHGHKVWDVTTGQGLTFMTAAHIFPLSLGQKSMEYIFGEDAEDEINKAKMACFFPRLSNKPMMLTNSQ
jgi:hypothetical protein